MRKQDHVQESRSLHSAAEAAAPVGMTSEESAVGMTRGGELVVIRQS